MEELHKKYNRIVAGLVFFITLAVYLTTVAPTVAFWDCGEYIGAAHSLGVPHPPGNPLYVLLGRVFSIAFFFFRQVAFRVNLISVISGAVASLFIYLITVRALISFTGTPDTLWKRLTLYIGGAVGGFFCAFGYTFWFSAVEASVYLPSMMVIAICTWLALVWHQSKDPGRDRLLVLFSYLGYLGIGIHMMSMLALIPVFVFIVIADKDKLEDWRLWGAAFLLSTVIFQVTAFLYIAPLLIILAASYSFFRFKDIKYIGPMLFGALFIWQLIRAFGQPASSITAGTLLGTLWPFALLLGLTVFELVATDDGSAHKIVHRWRFIFFVALFATLGYSVHIYIPIRSALEPVIDENHPTLEVSESGKVEWDAFKGFLERKQYGSESMISRMFWRRGFWQNQLGIDGHMGFGGFHITQFYHFGRTVGTDREKSVFENWKENGFWALLLYLIPTVFMIFGWFYFFERNRDVAILLIFIYLATSIGMVLYMNFADGRNAEKRDYVAWSHSRGMDKPGLGQGLFPDTREHAQDTPTVHREVRIRDYFFTAGFMFFGMWIGIATGCLLWALFTSKNKMVRSQLAPIAAVLLAVSPVLPLTQNYQGNNRTGDWVPYDYAYNLLMSCEKDGILITNGDNDTFPLWFLQEAEGIRKDVRIVNLSLLNTTWYIKQLKKLEPKVPISFSDARIDALTHELNPIKESIPYTMTNAGITINLPGRKEKNALRVQDKMVLHIVDANVWRKPIYFAVTVSRDNMMGLQPYLKMQGLAYRIMRNPVPRNEMIDLDRTLYMLDKVYRFRGLGDRTEPMSETGQKLMSNYAASFIQVALSLREPLNNLKQEIEDLEKAQADTIDDTLDVALQLSEKKAYYNEKLDIAVSKLDQCVALMPWDWRPRALRHEILFAHERYEEALKRVEEARKVEPKNAEYLRMEAQVLEKLGRSAEANSSLKDLAKTEADPWNTLALLAQKYEQAGLFDSAIAVMNQYQATNPGDSRPARMIARFQSLKRRMQTQDSAEVLSPETAGQKG